jgi:hypothetical protein
MDEDDVLVVEDFIEDTVITYAQLITPGEVAGQR